MQISCFRCGGTGNLPEYSWNKGGVCFTCGGDGQLNPLSFEKVKKHQDKPHSFLSKVGTRDLFNMIKEMPRGGFDQLNDMTQSAMKYEVRKRVEALGIDDAFGFGEMIKRGTEALDKLEKEMPKPWAKKGYGAYAEEIPVHWLTKFQGNSLRRDDNEMAKFAEELKKDGLQDPVMIIIGQEDRRVSIGEGNHRTFAFLKAGLDKVPARVVRNRTNPGGVFYDKMSAIPTKDYVKGDLKPSEVFDTYYDGDAVSEYTPEVLAKLGHTQLEMPNFKKEFFFVPRYGKGNYTKAIFSQQGDKVSKSVMNSINKAIDELKSLGVEDFSIEVIFTKEGDMEWIDEKKGYVSVDVEEVLKALHNRLELEQRWAKHGDPLDDIDLEDL